MTIVVGKNANTKCFTSGNFCEAFRANLVSSIKHMEEGAPQTARAARRPSEQKPPAMEQPVQQAELYYGQNPKR